MYTRYLPVQMAPCQGTLFSHLQQLGMGKQQPGDWTRREEGVRVSRDSSVHPREDKIKNSTRKPHHKLLTADELALPYK
jgi:hypothetical protein